MVAARARLDKTGLLHSRYVNFVGRGTVRREDANSRQAHSAHPRIFLERVPARHRLRDGLVSLEDVERYPLRSGDDGR